MGKIKKLVSMVLVVVMMFSCLTVISNVSVKADDAVTWQKKAIVSPTEKKLVGAGYIDIKWNNTLENVKQYKIFVDGVLKKTLLPSGETMSIEFYTTKVSAHNTYIVADLKDGSSVKTDTRTFYVTKKGVCVNDKDMGTKVDPAAMNIGWYYNWGSKSFKETNFSNKKFYDLEFVPMIWGDPNEEFSTIFNRVKSNGYKYMLSYNEPDLKWESNTDPGTMISRWNMFRENKGSIRLGSPATETFQINSDKWWTPFWNGLTVTEKNDMSFIAVHAYQHYYDNADTALQYLHAIDEIYAKYHKPIWVTEFAVADSYNKFSPTNAKHNAQVQEFMKIVLKGLNERSYVERYAWFDFNPKDDVTGASGIFHYSGEITALGQIYANIGNPAGYNNRTYSVSSSIAKNTSIAACVAAVDTKIYSLTSKKKAFGYSFKAVKRASGYQLQYSLNKKFKKAKKYKTKTVNLKATKAATRTGTIKKLDKKKRTYYVRVRAYKVLNGTKYYCKWTKAKKVKTKSAIKKKKTKKKSKKK